MHGLVYSVAKLAIGKEFTLMDGSDASYDRHEYYNRNEYCRYALVTNFDGPLKLSTRLPIQLRALHCVGCKKMELNDDSFSFARGLRVLSLSESSMKKLPESVCQLRHLGYLNLSGCSGLAILPESLGDLINLLHMNLSGCSGLVKLPQSFGNLINLLYLDFSGCSGLVKLPQSFGNLIKLLHIDLSGCYELAELGESFENLKNLVYLDLSFWSCFEEIPVIGGFTSLQHLNLSHPNCYVGENLLDLEYYLSKLTNLRHLNLSMCLNPILYYMSEDSSLEYIEYCISGLSSLEHLDLSQNIFLRDLPESLGNHLSKLHTLDVSGCVRLKRVHRWMCELDCLKLENCHGLESYQFVVRIDPDYSRSNLSQLEDANYQELEISCLEKVKSKEEAQIIRLVEKEKLRKLKLCWTVGSEGYVDEIALLGELMPPQNLQCLELHGYNGQTCLPAWWTWRICCSHLLSLVEITMEDIPSCHCLPTLGLLPNLQRVTLRKMASLTRIDAGDLDGGNRASFKRLSKVTIDDMEILKVFVFPGVDELVIRNCPELSFGPLPPRAQRLVISESDKVMMMYSSGNGGGAERHGDAEAPSTSSTPVNVLVVECCDAHQGDWNLLHHLPGLKTLCISHCDSMTSLPKYLGNLSSLRELAVDRCNSIESLPQSIFELPNLKGLYISDCHPALKIWCEAEENRKKLAPLGLKYEYGALLSLATSLLCF
jgi:Leucine-rich repeat (LRR) protein